MKKFIVEIEISEQSYFWDSWRVSFLQTDFFLIA